MAEHIPMRRPAERNAVCRSCDKIIEPGTEMITWYSWRNRGMHIHLCLTCAKRLGEMACG